MEKNSNNEKIFEIDDMILEMEKRLGVGNQCQTYLVKNSKDEKEKYVLKEYFEPYQKSMQKEIEFLKMLRHNGVPEFIGINSEKSFYLMEYIPGKNLREILNNKKRLTEEDVLKYIYKLSDILYCAHEKGIAHRDIKPENIIINSIGEPILVDFGIGKNLNNSLVTENQQGTKEYYPYIDEFDENTKEVHYHQYDIFSLGAVMYELVHGELPWGNTKDIYSIAFSQSEGVEVFNKSISYDTHKICLKMLEKRDNRYTSMKEVKDEILKSPLFYENKYNHGSKKNMSTKIWENILTLGMSGVILGLLYGTNYTDIFKRETIEKQQVIQDSGFLNQTNIYMKEIIKYKERKYENITVEEIKNTYNILKNLSENNKVISSQEKKKNKNLLAEISLDKLYLKFRKLISKDESTIWASGANEVYKFEEAYRYSYFTYSLEALEEYVQICKVYETISSESTYKGKDVRDLLFYMHIGSPIYTDKSIISLFNYDYKTKRILVNDVMNTENIERSVQKLLILEDEKEIEEYSEKLFNVLEKKIKINELKALSYYFAAHRKIEEYFLLSKRENAIKNQLTINTTLNKARFFAIMSCIEENLGANMLLYSDSGKVMIPDSSWLDLPSKHGDNSPTLSVKENIFSTELIFNHLLYEGALTALFRNKKYNSKYIMSVHMPVKSTYNIKAPPSMASGFIEYSIQDRNINLKNYQFDVNKKIYSMRRESCEIRLKYYGLGMFSVFKNRVSISVRKKDIEKGEYLNCYLISRVFDSIISEMSGFYKNGFAVEKYERHGGMIDLVEGGSEEIDNFSSLTRKYLENDYGNIFDIVYAGENINHIVLEKNFGELSCYYFLLNYWFKIDPLLNRKDIKNIGFNKEITSKNGSCLETIWNTHLTYIIYCNSRGTLYEEACLNKFNIQATKMKEIYSDYNFKVGSCPHFYYLALERMIYYMNRDDPKNNKKYTNNLKLFKHYLNEFSKE